MDDLDKGLFPRAASYLAQLPNGLSSYPECQVVSEAFSSVTEEFPTLIQSRGLPRQVNEYLQGRYVSKWMPVALANTMLLMVYDRCFDSENAYITASRKNILRVFRRPAYRALMFIMSPSLVALGAKERYAKMYRGIGLKPSPLQKEGKRSTIAVALNHPAGIYSDRLLQRRTGEAMVVAIEAAGAKDAKMMVKVKDPSNLTYDISWEY